MSANQHELDRIKSLQTSSETAKQIWDALVALSGKATRGSTYAPEFAGSLSKIRAVMEYGTAGQQKVMLKTLQASLSSYETLKAKALEFSYGDPQLKMQDLFTLGTDSVSYLHSHPYFHLDSDAIGEQYLIIQSLKLCAEGRPSEIASRALDTRAIQNWLKLPDPENPDIEWADLADLGPARAVQNPELSTYRKLSPKDVTWFTELSRKYRDEFVTARLSVVTNSERFWSFWNELHKTFSADANQAHFIDSQATGYMTMTMRAHELDELMNDYRIETVELRDDADPR